MDLVIRPPRAGSVDALGGPPHAAPGARGRGVEETRARRARRSLKPQLNQIRAWVRQGRTDAWIAHQLEVSASELREFRKQHDLTPDDEKGGGGEVDLRDEIEAEVEAATAEEAEQEEDEPDDEDGEDTEDGEESRERAPRSDRSGEAGSGDRAKRRRRRGRRGGRGRRKELEATFDHGERDGYGLWAGPPGQQHPRSPRPAGGQ